MILRRVKLFGLVILLMLCINIVKAQHITLLQQGKPTSIRGLSVVDNNIAWISGSKGYIALTKDGGKTWAWQQIKGYERSDFRAIQAFSAKEAIIMSSGIPAVILKTINGGKTWSEKYRNTDTAYFFDAMDFSSTKHGLLLGDPINNKWVIMETNDGGESWYPFKKTPVALPGEAAFAASGTCLQIGKNYINFVSGGTAARYFRYNLSDTTWSIDYLPLVQGKSSQGAFSFAGPYVFVGGDYANDKLTNGVACWYSPMLAGIKNGYTLSKEEPSGFQSCVEYLSRSTYLSTGTPGSNISKDGGQTWSQIDNASFNVCRKAKHGTLVLLAGNDGKIAIFEP
jgi:photosystem II stability/assembly factor-like uncharacterized protein